MYKINYYFGHIEELTTVSYTHLYVIIHKAAEIIPEVIRVVPEKRTGSEVPFTIPNTCPVCEFPTVRREGEAAVRCTNKHCPCLLYTSKALNLDDKYYPVGAMIAAISDAKNKLLFASDFRKQARDFYQQKVADVYEYYERELRKNNALDFDDLLLVAVKLLQSNEAVLDKYSKRFRYVMIDEYQDTNHACLLYTSSIWQHFWTGVRLPSSPPNIKAKARRYVSVSYTHLGFFSWCC